ncbi:MAG: hypothetical protein HOI95_17300 [Chromatiales bacterium]|jgi:arginase family enzyme|nr:hypothetical protein [Chromatiales bacterium]
MTDAAQDHLATLHLRPAATFYGAPVGDVEDLRPDSIAAIGLYCDHFSGGRPGGRFAPRQIRYASTCSNRPTLGCIVDLGDFNVFPLESKRTLKVLAEQSQRVVATSAKLFAIGGDYSVSPAIVQGIVRETGPHRPA